MKRIVLLSALTLVFSSCDVLQEIVDTSLSQPAALTSGEIASGLKQALEFGITEGATKLSQQDGYFKSAYKILLPPEARKVTEKLKSIPGFTNVENIILEKINRGAEDAAKKAAPIFKNAITSMTFNDALGILMGNQNAATRYLQNATTNKLYAEFNPVIAESLDKFSARKYWADAVNAYNKIPLVEKANPDLDDYVTKQALTGLFSMVEKKEIEIRSNIASRTTDLLKKVFAKQDK
ncbi:MAG: DUF4197 domain-containing protein [Saprospirales bacterium]|nr:DUF4197 domain-containing protein [Saprospirales bacterium]MBK6903165.1 DUF4197 domain-containing protein [Saprospirales bacterium]MBK7334716.1 DUF4197 domain-containing protein [Saprospirales bacterium]